MVPCIRAVNAFKRMKIMLTEEHKKALSSLGVATLYHYGSRARGVARERSDYDVGVVFTDPADADEMQKYLRVYEVLSEVIPDTLNGPKLDIALLQSANAKLQLDAINYGKVIFDGNARVRADYEERVLKLYDDYRFLQKEYEEANFTAFRA